MDLIQLDDVGSETLQDLLTFVRSSTLRFKTSHIPTIDNGSVSPLIGGDVVQIQGPGKTHLLYHLLISCLLPQRYDAAQLDGWDMAAVIFDDGSFDHSRLLQLAVFRVQRALPDEQISESEITEFVKKCLRKLHVFKPTSSYQLAFTLVHLPRYHANNMPAHEIGLVSIESINAFHWSNHYIEQMHLITGEPSKTTFANPIHHVLDALNRFRLSHRPVVVFTNWDIPTKSSGEPFSPLPVTHHITLSEVRALPHYGRDISLTEAAQEEEYFREKVGYSTECTGVIQNRSRVGQFLLRISENEFDVL